MAKTPYIDLKSEDILSAHISGLQHSVNKLEEVLNMKTSSVSGHTLVAVADQDDPSLRYRIYEGTIRGWLDSPAPIVYRNGTPVDPSEYVISPGHGVVVFHDQQLSSDVITADFDYIVSQSATIESIQNDLSSLPGIQSDVSQLKTDIAMVAGGAAPIDTLNVLINVDMWSHFKRSLASITGAQNVLVYGDTLDIFPFPVMQQMTFSEVGLQLGKHAASSTQAKIAIYADNGEGYPGSLVFESAEMSWSGTVGTEVHEWQYAPANITLNPGLYWIARFNSADSQWDGLANTDAIVLNLIDRSAGTSTTYGGYRASLPYANGFPDPFPSSIPAFARSAYASPWIRKA
ncbi:hypothetical protein [Aeribacillus pallidus]|uniref:hypothetical protein n=1 Tax=Aeribacillus pallidus TaxID=33936 RepID=UPI003D1BEB30